MTDPVTVYLGLGSNLGNRVAALRTGVEVLRRNGVEPADFSSLYHSRPKYMKDQPPFVNTVGRFTTRLDPANLLKACKEAEQAAGRQERERYGPRELDVDLLIYGEELIRETDLEVPHPALSERLFVLEPLTELAPDLVVPGLGEVKTLLADALESLPLEERVIPLGAFDPPRGRPLDGSLDDQG